MPDALSIERAVALFSAKAVLAALPSTSVLAVTARAASMGFRHGAATALGVVAGDVQFILLAIFGLAMLAETLGTSFRFFHFAGGLYLLWMGTVLVRTRVSTMLVPCAVPGALYGSFMAGLLITIGDQKAVLFYLGFLPAFVDLHDVGAIDIATIIVIAVVAVGGVKLVYAALAHRTARLLGPRFSRGMNLLAATIMFGVGLWLLVRAVSTVSA
ncbi:MAG: LysE family translocator [Pseudomonadota bacterium]|nr:LysE family translocator [Pseudomonadota bacterium]